MADKGRSNFCVAFTMSLCALESRPLVNKSAIRSHTALILRMQALRSYLRLSCGLELHTLPNTKVSTAKDDDEKLHEGQIAPGPLPFS